MQMTRILTAGAALGCALGTGLVVQSFVKGSDPTPQIEIAAASMTGDILQSVDKASAYPALADAPKVMSPAKRPAQESAFSATVTKIALNDAPGMDPVPLSPALDCDRSMDAMVVPGAMVDLTLSAPCLRGARFTVHHNGMMFTALTDEAGAATMTVPALSETALFIAAFADGEGAVATVAVPGLQDVDRAVVQWRGNTGLQVHAHEFGAAYGADGHVWKGTGSGEGFLTVLGDTELDDARVAEIYTFPSSDSVRDGSVTLSVEAEVTQDNCGRDIEAQSIQLQPGDEPRAQELVLSVPDCDAIGDFLVLKNLLNDLTIAAK